MSWAELKSALEGSFGLSQDAMHIYAAVLIQLAAAAAVRKTLAHPVPWLTVLLFEVANEWADVRDDGLTEEWELWGAWHDVLNTMALPTLLLMLARWAPGLFRRQPAVPQPPSRSAATGERPADES